jgi:putative hydrolase of the HAD superfamily
VDPRQPTPLPPGGPAGHYQHVARAPRGQAAGEAGRAVAVSPVRHVLLDADGVIQHIPGGWFAAIEPYLGERSREFLHRTWQDELPMLAGQGDYLPVLAATLAEYGVTVPVGDVYADVWHRIEVVGESVELVHALRRNGYGVHLATNQEQYRAAYMRDVLDYDALFDVSCYSCDLGVAKPAPAFFAEAARRVGADPSAILFIDDSARNVDGARTAGLAAAQWSFEQGHHALAEVLASHGVITDPASDSTRQ